MLGRPDVTRGFGNCVSTVSAKGLRRQVKSECATTQFGAGGVTASLGAGALSKLSNQAHPLTTERKQHRQCGLDSIDYRLNKLGAARQRPSEAHPLLSHISEPTA